MSKQYITIDRDFFEHLLNCLANQKFTSWKASVGTEEFKNQFAIDKAYNEAMELLRQKGLSNIRVFKT